MVRSIPINTSDHFGSIPLAIGLFASVSALVALCAKHARTRVTRKNVVITERSEANDSKIAPRSPLRSVPKQLITTISNKAIPLIYNRKAGDDSESENRAREGFGDGGLWQKKILMGEKCQPPEFSGVIYYDNCGNQISELPPRSPRASHLPSFSFPVVKEAN